MARIELSFNDKNYVIEYNRASIREFLKHKDDKDELEQVVTLIRCGLIMHHMNDMPSSDEIFGWVLSMGGDAERFVEALREMIQDTLNVLKADRKNLKWEKVA